MVKYDAIGFDSFSRKVPKTSVCLLNLQPFAGLEGKCELEAAHRGRQMIEDGSLQLYFSTWPSFPSILVILPLMVDCGDHEYTQPRPWLLSFPSLTASFFLSLFLPYCNAAGFPPPCTSCLAAFCTAPDCVSMEKAIRGPVPL